MLPAALRTRPGWEPPHSSQGNLLSMGRQEANIFVSSGTKLQELGFSFSNTSPSSPSAGQARCSAISQHTRSGPVWARLQIETKPPARCTHVSPGPLCSPQPPFRAPGLTGQIQRLPVKKQNRNGYNIAPGITKEGPSQKFICSDRAKQR